MLSVELGDAPLDGVAAPQVLPVEISEVPLPGVSEPEALNLLEVREVARPALVTVLGAPVQGRLIDQPVGGVAAGADATAVCVAVGSVAVGLIVALSGINKSPF